MKQKLYKYSVCKINMDKKKIGAFAWIIGYFVVLYPFFQVHHGNLIYGLFTGIFGVAVAIFIMIGGLKRS